MLRICQCAAGLCGWRRSSATRQRLLGRPGRATPRGRQLRQGAERRPDPVHDRVRHVRLLGHAPDRPVRHVLRHRVQRPLDQFRDHFVFHGGRTGTRPRGPRPASRRTARATCLPCVLVHADPPGDVPASKPLDAEKDDPATAGQRSRRLAPSDMRICNILTHSTKLPNLNVSAVPARASRARCTREEFGPRWPASHQRSSPRATCDLRFARRSVVGLRGDSRHGWAGCRPADR